MLAEWHVEVQREKGFERLRFKAHKPWTSNSFYQWHFDVLRVNEAEIPHSISSPGKGICQLSWGEGGTRGGFPWPQSIGKVVQRHFLELKKKKFNLSPGITFHLEAIEYFNCKQVIEFYSAFFKIKKLNKGPKLSTQLFPRVTAMLGVGWGFTFLMKALFLHLLKSRRVRLQL
jgi:hypothetical protein